MTTQVCNECGLPEDLCICEEGLENIDFRIELEENRTHGKKVTIVNVNKNINKEDDFDISDLSSSIKSSLGCGGTIKEKDNVLSLEFQGDHISNIEEYIEGYIEDSNWDISNKEIIFTYE